MFRQIQDWILVVLWRRKRITSRLVKKRNRLIFCSTCNCFRELIQFEECHIGHESWRLPEIARVLHVYHYSLLCPIGSKLSLFSFYEHRFTRYRSIFKIAMFGCELYSLYRKRDIRPNFKISIFEEFSFYTRQRNWVEMSPRCSGFQNTGHFSKFRHVGMKLNHW